MVMFQMCMLFLTFRDGIRFGNGRLITTIYKWIFVLARMYSSWSKYAPVALYLWSCLHVLLSKQMAHRLMWDRSTCAHNAPGKNIPNDRRLEHVNCPAKACLKKRGHINLNDRALNDIRSGILPLHDLCRSFDKANNVPRPASSCSSSDRSTYNESDERDMLKVLLESKALVELTDPAGRAHPAFEGIHKDPFASLDVDELRRYFTKWHRTHTDLQACLYGRFFKIPGAIHDVLRAQRAGPPHEAKG